VLWLSFGPSSPQAGRTSARDRPPGCAGAIERTSADSLVRFQPVDLGLVADHQMEPEAVDVGPQLLSSPAGTVTDPPLIVAFSVPLWSGSGQAPCP
jgi:hypothetical protein